MFPGGGIELMSFSKKFFEGFSIVPSIKILGCCVNKSIQKVQWGVEYTVLAYLYFYSQIVNKFLF